jgi:hypothetical protein
MNCSYLGNLIPECLLGNEIANYYIVFIGKEII